MMIGFLRIFAITCVALICGKLVSKLKLPAILGWLIAGIVFGPYLAEVVTLDITGALWYKIFIKFLECFAGVMIGREIIFKKIARSGKQIVGITFVQSIGTFLFVTAAFMVVFLITDIPIYLAFIFGGIALATAPAPALSIVNEYHTSGPVTKYLGFTLLPHSGVSLVFTGISTTTLLTIDASLANIVSGTIVAAAIINEIIAVIIAKFAFKWAGEIK